MESIYFWRANTVAIRQASLLTYVDMHIDGLIGIPCVDTTESTSESKYRYGKFTADNWEHIPLNKFPKEFRVHLLLLGVG